MIATLTALSLACMPVPHPHPVVLVPTTTSCEGADRVTRNHDGQEVSRAFLACTSVSCEGADLVRRDFNFNREVSRQPGARACVNVRCEGADLVTRARTGFELSRWVSAPSCPVRVRLSSDPAWHYGLSVRG